MRGPPYGMDPRHRLRQPGIAPHREGDPRRGHDRRVESRERGQQPTDHDHRHTERRHELFRGADDRRLLELSEELPRHRVGQLDRGQRDENDQQVDRHRYAEGDERRPRDIDFGLFDLLRKGGDQVVTLESDEGEPHRHEHAARTAREERGEVGGGGLGHPHDPAQSIADEDGEHDKLAKREKVLGQPSDLGTACVQANEKEPNGDGDHEHSGVFANHPKDAIGRPRHIFQEELPEVAGETKSVEAAGYGISEPEQPAGGEPHDAGERSANISVPAPRLGHRRRQLGVGEGGEQGDHAVQGKRENRGRPCLTSRDPGEHKDPGPDHGAHTHHRGVE